MYNYEALQYVNSSSLGLINPEEGGTPAKYRSYIIGDTEQSNEAYYTLGTNLHFIFLEKKVPVVVEKYPSEAVKAIIDKVITHRNILASKSITEVSDDLEDYRTKILECAKEENYHGNKKDDTRIDSVIKSGKEYWDIVMAAKDVPMVTEKQATLTSNIRTNLNLRPQVKALIETPEEKDVEYFTELEIFWEEDYTGLNMKCKSKLDRVKLDHKRKTFSIRDFKTSGKQVEGYQTWFEAYRTYRQIRFYEKAFQYYLKEKGLGDYTPDKHYIIVAETGTEGRVRSFEVSRAYLYKGDIEIDNILHRIKTHVEENQWVFSLEEQANEHFTLFPNQF